MVKFFAWFIRKTILSAILIYSFDVFAVSLNLIIPINVVTIFLIAFFDVPAMICLILFSMTF